MMDAGHLAAITGGFASVVVCIVAGAWTLSNKLQALAERIARLEATCKARGIACGMREDD